MKFPKISIITIVFNGERYLENLIKNIAKQEYPNKEHIIIDGGSEDASIDIIKRYENHLSFWISERDNGVSDAMNKGVKYATGDFILYMHSDDEFTTNDVLKRMIEVLQSEPNHWITGFYHFVDENNSIIRSDKLIAHSFLGMMVRNIIRHQATLVPRYFFDKIEFEKKYKFAMDYKFFLNVWKEFGPPIFYKKYLVRFRLDGKNLSSDFYSSLKDEFCARKDFRKENNQEYILYIDYIIYFIRYLKIKFYHSVKIRFNEE